MNNGQVQTVLREKKTKILHFSDGIEEVTDDDSDIMDGPDEGAEQPEIDEVSFMLQILLCPLSYKLNSRAQWSGCRGYC